MMKKKKGYESPTMTLTVLATTDIVTTSGTEQIEKSDSLTVTGYTKDLWY